jgi:hypothetical protein
MDHIRDCLDYGALKGMGQWRSGGWGRFSWEQISEKITDSKSEDK